MNIGNGEKSKPKGDSWKISKIYKPPPRAIKEKKRRQKLLIQQKEERDVTTDPKNLKRIKKKFY